MCHVYYDLRLSVRSTIPNFININQLTRTFAWRMAIDIHSTAYQTGTRKRVYRIDCKPFIMLWMNIKNTHFLRHFYQPLVVGSVLGYSTLLNG